MSAFVWFVIGCFVGGLFGAGGMAIAFMADDDEEDDAPP